MFPKIIYFVKTVALKNTYLFKDPSFPIYAKLFRKALQHEIFSFKLFIKILIQITVKNIILTFIVNQTSFLRHKKVGTQKLNEISQSMNK